MFDIRDVFVSFYYSKISLENTLKQVLLIHFYRIVPFATASHKCVCCIFLCKYVRICVFYLCNICLDARMLQLISVYK